MKTIDDIPADELVTLTASMDRAFKVLGCDPACHCCEGDISVGDTFKLACVDENDEMLCNDCTPEKLIATRKEEEERARIFAEDRRLSYSGVGRRAAGSGFSRPHRGDQ